MNANEEERRRERLRELQKMREQVTVQQSADAGTTGTTGTTSESDNRRGAKLRELLQGRQGASAGTDSKRAEGYYEH